MIFLLFLCAFSFPGDVQAQRKLFNEWRSQHNKVYTTLEETQTRFENFVNSLKRIELKNKYSKGGAKFGLNKFSDYSPEEFRAKYLLVNTINSTGIHESFQAPPNKAIADQYDWRPLGVVSNVKDQEQCGSCWAFSVTETIESAWMLKMNISNTTFPPLSPQQIVDCDAIDMGCDGGNPPTAYDYVQAAGGLDTETFYPYKAVDGTCKFDKSKVVASISGWEYATSDWDETTLKQNLVSKGPLSICLDAANWQDYTSGVMTAWQCAWINQLDHCVQAVGYNVASSTPYWIVRNSWGADWGEGGYIRLSYGENTCGLTYEATYAVV